MPSKIHQLLRRTPLRYWYHRIKKARGAGGQSDEAVILRRLAVDCPKTFVEFGFHPTEYNCSALTDFSGLLLDGDGDTVRLARRLLPSRIEVRERFLTLDTLSEVGRHFPELGVLSIDVDGNDYWFLEKLLAVRPRLVAVEYNASFGLEPITVPYDSAFERHAKHPSGWYHGASLTALCNLCAGQKMKLVAVSSGGSNAFFVDAGSPIPALKPESAFRENILRNQWSGTTAKQQWAQLKGLEYVRV